MCDSILYIEKSFTYKFKLQMHIDPIVIYKMNI